MEKKASFAYSKSITLKKSDFILPLFKRKVWDKDSETTRVYNWSTSIPDRWIEIKGQGHFKHVSETSNIKNTLDFLVSSQKYINKISAPTLEKYNSSTEHKAPKIIKPKTSNSWKKSINRLPETLTKPLDAENIPARPIHLKSSFTARHWPKKRVSSSLKPKCTTQSQCFQFEDFALKETESFPDLKQFNDKYTITNFALPNGLTAAHKDNEENEPKNSSVIHNAKLDEFLKRFDKKDANIEAPKERRGVNGWKLTRGSIKSYQKGRSSSMPRLDSER